MAATMATTETIYFMSSPPIAPLSAGLLSMACSTATTGRLMRPRCLSAVHTQVYKSYFFAYCETHSEVRAAELSIRPLRISRLRYRSLFVLVIAGQASADCRRSLRFGRLTAAKRIATNDISTCPLLAASLHEAAERSRPTSPSTKAPPRTTRTARDDDRRGARGRLLAGDGELRAQPQRDDQDFGDRCASACSPRHGRSATRPPPARSSPPRSNARPADRSALRSTSCRPAPRRSSRSRARGRRRGAQANVILVAQTQSDPEDGAQDTARR